MTAATSGPAHAEEYLRLLAETALRRRDATGLRAAARALAETGLLDGALVEDIVTGFETATAIRLPENAASELPTALRRRGAVPGMPRHRGSRLPPAGGNAPRTPDPATVTDVSTRLSYRDTGRTVDFYLFALVRTAQEASLSVAGHTLRDDPGDWAGHDTLAVYNDLAAMDNAGNRYELRFSGGGSDAWTHGRLHLAPLPPRDVTWLDVRVRDGAPTRVSLTGSGPAAGRAPITFTVTPRPLTRPERYLQALAEVAIAATGWRAALSSLAAATRALLAADALPAGSRLPGQVAELCSRARLPGDGLPGPSLIPGHWSSVLDAYPFGDRDPYASGESHPPPAVASLAMPFPEIDGAGNVLTALVSRGKMTELHGSFGTNVEADSLGSCWLRDDSGQWHAALPGGGETSMRGAVMSHAILVPPVPPSARSAEIVIAGATTQARATVPLAWWAP